ncbi:hypothetical protein ACQP2F_14425 [Actinoplanes sp. CA-030573]|uniref:hypothetical protein n=1 Tax=Actinoplanes sp. CA-030573 TaxID=3239898 RepID=UPI003D942649
MNTVRPAHEPHRIMTDDELTGSPLRTTALIATGDLHLSPSLPPVPITVSHLTGTDARNGRLTPQLAALLVGAYSAPGDTIVSVGADPALAGAAGAGGRIYLSVRDPHQLNQLEHVAGKLAMVVVSWPPAADPAADADGAAALFLSCRRLMRRNGCTIVAISQLPAGDTYRQHSAVLLPAAQQAGLAWQQHVVAFAGRAAPRANTDPAEHVAEPVAIHVDLLVFSVRGHGD